METYQFLNKKFLTFFVFAILFIPLSIVFARSTAERLSIRSIEGDNSSYNGSLAADGCCVVFVSGTSSLVAGDTNGFFDIFIRDLATGMIERIEGVGGAEPNDHSSVSDYLDISRDGRYVAFASQASNLVAGDTNGVIDVFLYDRDTNTSTLLSKDVFFGVLGNNTSVNPNIIDDDARYIVFESDATNLDDFDSNGFRDIFLAYRNGGFSTIERVNVCGRVFLQPNGNSSAASFSDDMRYLSFYSDASNFVTGDTNGTNDVFLCDRDTDTLTRISVSELGEEGDGASEWAAVSPDGTFVVFYSHASNLVPGDTNGVSDIFLYDIASRSITRISVSEEGVESNGDSYIVPSHSISDDGNLIVFDSGASNIAEGDMNGAQDVFVYRKEDGKIRRVTHAFDGGDIDDYAVASYITGDGTKITFESAATNLVEGDTNNFGDVFIMDTPSFDSPSYQSHHARLTGGNQLRRLLILSGLSSFNFEEMFQIPSRE